MAKIFFFLLCFTLVFSAESTKKTVCLNMIVKDESPVIARCLSSVKHLIDYWVIVDTGSTDGTQDVIKKVMKDRPGELYQRPWKNFGHNRNEALQLAKGKGDYLLFIDADETLEGSFDKSKLTSDVYLVNVVLSKEPLTTFQRALLVNCHLDWAWKGVIHEKLECPGKQTYACFEGLALSAETRDGHRAQDPQKYLKDAHVLEKALQEDPSNADYRFYLAQSYQAAGKLDLALENYKKRANMQGWEQQTFWSKYSVPLLQAQFDVDEETLVRNYSEAYAYRPQRAEPLFRLAQHFYTKKHYLLGYALAQLGLKIPIPSDFVYVERWMYDYGMLAVYANCAFELGKYEEAATAYEKIAGIPTVPAQARKEARDTRFTALEKLALLR